MSRIINDKMDPHSLKSSCLGDASVVEENRSSKSSSLESNQCCNDDIQPSEPVINKSSDQTKDNEMTLLCQTPAESKFDPFAPGPDELMLAPKKMKSSYPPLQRLLSRDLIINSEEIAGTDLTEDPNAEECFLELIFTSLLELIISTKLMEISVNNRAAESDKIEECKTPTSLPFLTGFAETCPPAPRRPTLFSKRFDHSICRKLDFESCLN
ncbi:unknown protein 1-like [Phalaenopsis equestris]|uniref:unknown protein 1-like n=1 Tax=Phalaenopsis equestris TaxID=78828 RepID=UPI0009E544E7|nr:unknown protein 1-like [Phalaenopsis equestris]XP_020594112.1 unknown protein 1-like [Phalaenopsis equestris]